MFPVPASRGILPKTSMRNVAQLHSWGRVPTDPGSTRSDHPYSRAKSMEKNHKVYGALCFVVLKGNQKETTILGGPPPLKKETPKYPSDPL